MPDALQIRPPAADGHYTHNLARRRCRTQNPLTQRYIPIHSSCPECPNPMNQTPTWHGRTTRGWVLPTAAALLTIHTSPRLRWQTATALDGCHDAAQHLLLLLHLAPEFRKFCGQVGVCLRVIMVTARTCNPAWARACYFLGSRSPEVGGRREITGAPAAEQGRR